MKTEQPKTITYSYSHISEPRAAFSLPPQNSLAGEMYRIPMGYKHGIGTAATNGKEIMIDGAWFTELTLRERVFVLAHELFHIMFNHVRPNRLGKKYMKIWNIATDIVINSMLVVWGIGKVPKGVIEPDRYGNVDITLNSAKMRFNEAHKLQSEEVYEQLMKHIIDNPDNGEATEILDKNGNPVDAMDDLGVDEDLTHEEKEDNKQAMRRLVQENKKRGNLPGWLSDMLEGMLESKVDWRKELMAQISPLVKTKQTWSRPAKRSEGVGTYYPNRKKEGIIATVSVDTSGSIGKKELMYYAGEIKGIFDSFPPNSVKLTLLLHHTEVYSVQDNVSIDTLGKTKIKSGGTSHMDVFNKAKEAHTRLLICLTDGYSEFPTAPVPGMKTIILTTGGEQSLRHIPTNLGQIVQVEILDKE